MHGYFILGPALVAIFLLSKIIESKLKLPFSWNENALDRGALIKVFYILLLLPAASLINPYFTEGALYPFKILSQSVFGSLEGRYPFRFVAELQGIRFSSIIFDEIPLLSTVISIFFLSLLFNIRKADIFDMAVFFMFLALTLHANRHIALFALSGGIFSLFNMKSAEDELFYFDKKTTGAPKAILQRIAPALIAAILIANLFFTIAYFIGMANQRYIYNLKGNSKGFLFGIDETSVSYPSGAVGFIKRRGIKGNIFNFFNNGAYLIFGIYPDCKVFIDGRTELYGDALLKSMDVFFSKPQIINRVKDNLGIDIAVVPCSEPAAEIFKFLYNDENWKLVFFDGISSVFASKRPKFRDITRKSGVSLDDFLFEPDRKLIEIAKKRKAYPTFYVNAGRFFYYIGMYEKALEAMAVAEDIRPDGYDTRVIKAIALARLSRPKEALHEFLRAVRINPRNPVAYKNIGVFFAKAGQFDEAKRYFIKALRINPKDAEAKRYITEVGRCVKVEGR